MASQYLRIDGDTFRDPQNRQVILHGINVSGDCKFPTKPEGYSHLPDKFLDGDHVSFVDRPFSVDQAHVHLGRLKRWGFNTIRYLYTWECLEHEGPGKYDDAIVEHTIKILRIAKQYGFHVFMDPHQDVWSRFTGGSGAPMWTVYACGIDATKLLATEAALVHNTWPEPAEYPKMIWATNYSRLAVQTMFTFFFAGREFAPKCIIDGKNIQDYLQGHFINAVKHLAQRIHEAGDLEGSVVIGYETVNEPNKGYVAHPDLNTIPSSQKLKKGTCPTAWQAFLLGSGRACEVEVWEFGGLGPYKKGSQLVDPKGVSAWLDPETWDDTKYGWKRDPEWKIGTCVWAQHGLWDPSTDELLLPQYFCQHPETGETLDQEFWTDHYFMKHFRDYRDAIRSVWPESFILIQPQPFEIPPKIKGTKDGDDPNLVFASHFYDGITLLTKKWNKVWNVDVLGMLRGKYSSPVFAIKIGETAIRNCFKDQLNTIRQEGIDNMGTHPCLYTEIGIPYDMDDKHAYKTGDYSSQAAAIDANFYAVEGSRAAGLTWWVYTATNSHYWGDNWNGEDLSIYSAEDRPLPASPSNRDSELGLSVDPSHPSYSESQREGTVPATPGSIQKTLSIDGMSRNGPPSSSADDGPAGFRAAEAYVRAAPVAVHGAIESYGFDLRSCTFHLNLTAPSPTAQDYPTEVFLPAFHFPQSNQRTTVEVSGGKWEIRIVESVEGAPQQIFRWWHGEGEQHCTIKGLRRKRGQVLEEETVDEGYLEQFLPMVKNCSVM